MERWLVSENRDAHCAGSGERNSTVEITVAIEDTLQKVMLSVMRGGHNPGLSVLTNTIGDGTISNIPTSGACCIEWAMVSW
jgi:phosphohistidine phosphatase SixA